MNVTRGICLSGLVWMAASGCGSAPKSTAPAESGAAAGAEAAMSVEAPGTPLTEATVIELAKLRSDTASFEWFQFKPGVKKLILSGTPDSRHVSVLWYGYEGKPGMVPLHYHAKTESIFVIDGAQSDPKGQYPKGSFYFNPPASGHNVFDSAGLFLLSYAAPPDFTKTTDIPPYENVVVSADYSKLPMTACEAGQCYTPALSAEGGMKSRFIKPSVSTIAKANVLLVLQGSCTIAGQPIAADTLVVNKSTEPADYRVASATPDCLLFELAFD